MLQSGNWKFTCPWTKCRYYSHFACWEPCFSVLSEAEKNYTKILWEFINDLLSIKMAYLMRMYNSKRRVKFFTKNILLSKDCLRNIQNRECSQPNIKYSAWLKLFTSNTVNAIQAQMIQAKLQNSLLIWITYTPAPTQPGPRSYFK